MDNETKKDLDLQHSHWEKHWDHSKNPQSFFESPSNAVKIAAKQFKKKGNTKVLELGGGLGRDTLYLAKQGFQVHVLEYTEKGVQTIRDKAKAAGLIDSIIVIQHDVRESLPFEKDYFDYCFSHMLYCMAFTNKELEFLSQEIKRVLKQSAINVYTVRNTKDSMFGTGTHKGGNMYEIQGFIINFFDEIMIKRLSKGFELLEINEFEEGELPKRLYSVTLKKI
ncbi:class I SAM-dependent methyltransferase [Desulfuribacillus alkaliarsenatis]|uniref:6-O-methylguanine DNA methyltransferase n=1 Tax=Desulfuribacillus alkaliarsenatis TaxID=766136 RepID=A0A1E5G180_9FIRM|nr:class I SAM-dependent methyltransferase [Desulfuribacillus alkaliarsenatis]OEF96670.1 6-O-methylguanine DNA methyltransferase [Desulfuribacillus alkaliarsenatis]